jgi:hypothetical protein
LPSFSAGRGAPGCGCSLLSGQMNCVKPEIKHWRGL